MAEPSEEPGTWTRRLIAALWIGVILLLAGWLFHREISRVMAWTYSWFVKKIGHAFYW